MVDDERWIAHSIDDGRWRVGSSVGVPVWLNRDPLFIPGGPLRGWVGWDPASAAYFADLDLFPSGLDPVRMRPTRLGGRLGRYVTIDALRNGLALRGHHLCGRSLDRLDGLRSRVERQWGEVMIEGGAGPDGGWFDLVLPDRRRLNLRSEIAFVGRGPETCLDEATNGVWRDGAWSEDLIRSLVRRVWSERWGPEEELFVDGLRLMLADRSGPTIRIGAGRLCDWYLFDSVADPLVAPSEGPVAACGSPAEVDRGCLGDTSINVDAIGRKDNPNASSFDGYWLG